MVEYQAGWTNMHLATLCGSYCLALLALLGIRCSTGVPVPWPDIYGNQFNIRLQPGCNCNQLQPTATNCNQSLGYCIHSMPLVFLIEIINHNIFFDNRRMTTIARLTNSDPSPEYKQPQPPAQHRWQRIAHAWVWNHCAFKGRKAEYHIYMSRDYRAGELRVA